MADNYVPTIGDKISVSHPDGLYCDNVSGTVFTQNYNVQDIDKTDAYGIKLTSVQRGQTIETNVELNWFNTELTGRKVKKLN